MEKYKRALRRKALAYEIGGFKPPTDPLQSWFGRVNVCAPGEQWPQTDSKPMHALCQINLTNLPFCPPYLEGIELITGGWPSLIQSEIFWVPSNSHPAAPAYVFQVDSSEKGNWMWGDNGTGYFGRGTAPGMDDEWSLAWQCY